MADGIGHQASADGSAIDSFQDPKFWNSHVVGAASHKPSCTRIFHHTSWNPSLFSFNSIVVVHPSVQTYSLRIAGKVSPLGGYRTCGPFAEEPAVLVLDWESCFPTGGHVNTVHSNHQKLIIKCRFRRLVCVALLSRLDAKRPASVIQSR